MSGNGNYVAVLTGTIVSVTIGAVAQTHYNTVSPPAVRPFTDTSSLAERVTALESQNAALTARVTKLEQMLADQKQSTDKDSFGTKFRLTALEATADKQKNTNEVLRGNISTVVNWGNEFYNEYLSHTHSYLDNPHASVTNPFPQAWVYQTSSPYPIQYSNIGDLEDHNSGDLKTTEQRIDQALANSRVPPPPPHLQPPKLQPMP